MEITSDDKKLLKQANSLAVAKKDLGEVIAKKLAMRITELKAVDSIEELLAGPGRWELLQQNRAGTYSGRLNGNYRLIVKFIAKKTDYGETSEVDVEVVAVEEIVIEEEQSADLIEIVDYHEKKNFR